MNTNDFSGVYDYEKEEAEYEYSQFIEFEKEYTQEENILRVEKLAIYWGKVLPETFFEFKMYWNLVAIDIYKMKSI